MSFSVALTALPTQLLPSPLRRKGILFSTTFIVVKETYMYCTNVTTVCCRCRVSCFPLKLRYVDEGISRLACASGHLWFPTPFHSPTVMILIPDTDDVRYFQESTAMDYVAPWMILWYSLVQNCNLAFDNSISRFVFEDKCRKKWCSTYRAPTFTKSDIALDRPIMLLLLVNY